MDKFFGQGKQAKEYEALVLSSLDPEDTEGEAELMQTRWFDVAMLHPAEATYLFAHTYKKQVKHFAENYIDIHRAEHSRSFTPDDIFKSRDLLPMWRARRCADKLGIPYDFVLRYAQERAFNSTMKFFPRPNQLYSEEFELDLKNIWLESMMRSMRYSKLMAYRNKFYIGSAVQNRHHAFIADQIDNRQPSSRPGLIGRLLHEEYLTPNFIQARWGDAALDSATQTARKLALSHH